MAPASRAPAAAASARVNFTRNLSASSAASRFSTYGGCGI